MAKWIFTTNNAGRIRSFTVTAATKQEAIYKAIIKEKRTGAACFDWSIRLKSVY